jgi:predicted RNA-binding Zn ribbon-like protein
MRDGKDIQLIGGEVCLDFINTIHDRSLENSADYLEGGYASLLQWSEYAGVWDRKLILKLQSEHRARNEKSHVYENAIMLRQALFDIFGSIADHKKIPPAALSTFNVFLSGAFLHKKVVAHKNKYLSEWELSDSSADWLLWPIIESAYLLLTGDQLQKIKKCPACYWVFVDKSKGGKRKWCNMDTCGAIDKSRRHYHLKIKKQNV